MEFKIVVKISGRKVINCLVSKNDIDGYITDLIKLDILRRSGEKLSDSLINEILSKYDSSSLIKNEDIELLLDDSWM